MVVDRRLVDHHLADLERHVRLLEEERGRPRGEIEADPVRAAGVQHLLQIAVETVSNLANHLAAECGWETPRSYVDSLANLHRHGVVREAGLARRLEQMARFRNLVVHRYWEVDMGEVYRILQDHLDDFREVAEAVRRYLREHPDR